MMRRLSVFRLVLFSLVILAGVGLFLVLSRQTPVLVTPSGQESRP